MPVDPKSDRLTRRIAGSASVLAIVVRVAFLLTPAGGLDGDEGVTGIMARRIAAGEDFYVFFLGQSYNSSVEQYPQALLFAIGLPVHPLVLRVPQLLMAGVACYLMYVVGRRLLHTSWHAALASVLFAVGPYFLIWKGARSFGSYSAELLVVLVALLLVLRLDDVVDRRRRRLAVCAGVGFCFGVTYWLTFSGYFVLGPVALWLAASIRRDARAVGAAVAGVAVGLVPTIYWTVTSGSFPLPRPGYRPTSAGERFSNLFDEVGREFLGVAHINGAPGWPVWLGRFALWLLASAALVAVVARWRGIWAILTLRSAHRRPFDLILLSVPIVVAAYTASKYAWFTTEPRYLFTAFPVLLFGLAQLVPRRRVLGPVVAAGLVLLVGGTSITLLVSRAHDVPGDRDHDLAAVIDRLEVDGDTFVYAQYWTAMPLEFFAGDRLTVGTLIEPQRLLDERIAVDRAVDPVWVASRGVNSDDIQPMRKALVRADVRYRERRFGDASIFDRFSRPVRPWEIGLGVPVP